MLLLLLMLMLNHSNTCTALSLFIYFDKLVHPFEDVINFEIRVNMMIKSL